MREEEDGEKEKGDVPQEEEEEMGMGMWLALGSGGGSLMLPTELCVNNVSYARYALQCVSLRQAIKS